MLWPWEPCGGGCECNFWNNISPIALTFCFFAAVVVVSIMFFVVMAVVTILSLLCFQAVDNFDCYRNRFSNPKPTILGHATTVPDAKTFVSHPETSTSSAETTDLGHKTTAHQNFQIFDESCLLLGHESPKTRHPNDKLNRQTRRKEKCSFYLWAGKELKNHQRQIALEHGALSKASSGHCGIFFVFCLIAYVN